MRFADDAFGRLGLSEEASGPLREALSAGDGVILVAGPAGSGRGATLDAALGAAPDSLIVEEINDRATAERAIAAASTRLVLAAIQADHAVGAISRLRDLRIEPFSIAARLRLVVAQRSARRLCPDCRTPEQAGSNLSARLGFDPGTFVYAPRGCESCDGSGYRGRIGLFEALPVDVAIGRLIGMDGDEAVIASHAFRERPNLSGVARAMVRHGLIGAEEAIHHTRTPVRELV
jgi:general secretion pathway protein E